MAAGMRLILQGPHISSGNVCALCLPLQHRTPPPRSLSVLGTADAAAAGAAWCTAVWTSPISVAGSRPLGTARARFQTPASWLRQRYEKCRVHTQRGGGGEGGGVYGDEAAAVMDIVMRHIGPGLHDPFPAIGGAIGDWLHQGDALPAIAIVHGMCRFCPAHTLALGLSSELRRACGVLVLCPLLCGRALSRRRPCGAEAIALGCVGLLLAFAAGVQGEAGRAAHLLSWHHQQGSSVGLMVVGALDPCCSHIPQP